MIHHNRSRPLEVDPVEVSTALSPAIEVVQCELEKSEGRGLSVGEGMISADMMYANGSIGRDGSNRALVETNDYEAQLGILPEQVVIVGSHGSDLYEEVMLNLAPRNGGMDMCGKTEMQVKCWASTCCPGSSGRSCAKHHGKTG